MLANQFWKLEALGSKYMFQRLVFGWGPAAAGVRLQQYREDVDHAVRHEHRDRDVHRVHRLLGAPERLEPHPQATRDVERTTSPRRRCLLGGRTDAARRGVP